jgi:hypothetical protein
MDWQRIGIPSTSLTTRLATHRSNKRGAGEFDIDSMYVTPLRFELTFRSSQLSTNCFGRVLR